MSAVSAFEKIRNDQKSGICNTLTCTTYALLKQLAMLLNQLPRINNVSMLLSKEVVFQYLRIDNVHSPPYSFMTIPKYPKSLASAFSVFLSNHRQWYPQASLQVLL